VTVNQFKAFPKKLGAAFLSGVITGLITGVLLRVIMGIVAFVFPETARGLTLNGVIALLIVGLGFCLVNSIWFSLIEKVLPSPWYLKGLLYGLITLFVYGIPFFLSNPDNDLFGPQAPLGIALFSILFIVGGLLLAFCFHIINSWAQPERREKYMYVSFFILIIPALIMVIGTTYEMVYETIPAIRANW
jgi:hypothetical protein